MSGKRLIRPIAFVTLTIAALVAGCRVIGFGDGLLLGIAPASAVALVSVLVGRAPFALAAGAGFLLGDLAAALPPLVALVDGTAHGLAALAGAGAMRAIAHEHRPETKLGEYLLFLLGSACFAATVALAVLAAAILGLGAPELTPAGMAGLALVFELLGLLTFGAVLLNLRQFREYRENPQGAVPIASLGIVLIGFLWLLLGLPLDNFRPSDLTILLSIPLAFWIAMRPLSLDGAAVTFFIMHFALLLLIAHSGSVTGSDFVMSVIYLNLLTLACHFVHSINLDRLRAFAAVARARDELEERVAERTASLHAMTERAIAADHAKSRLLATVSHELHAPVDDVVGIASFVLTADLSPATRKNIEMIRGSGQYVQNVIDRVLEYSRMTQEPRGDELVEFDLAELMADVVDEAWNTPDADGLGISVIPLPAGATRRWGYRMGIRQVLANLVGNAFRFTRHGLVELRAQDLGEGWVRIEVEDTGPGVPPEDAERIFLPFEKAAHPAKRFPGSPGLGLAVCSEIVRRMGGRIGVSEGAEAGSVFWCELELPLVACSAPFARETAGEPGPVSDGLVI